MGRPQSSVSRLVTLVFIAAALVLAWFVAPLVAPVWMWRNVDFKQLAKETSQPEDLLHTEYTVVVRFHPRRNDYADPVPWQIVSMDPEWHTLDKQRDYEGHLLVRCTFVSDRTGTPVSQLFVGNSFKDRYFRAKAYRLPGGVLGFAPKRPVVIYKASTLEKLDIGEAEALDEDITRTKNWEDDDTWEDRDDGWATATAPN